MSDVGTVLHDPRLGTRGCHLLRRFAANERSSARRAGLSPDFESKTMGATRTRRSAAGELTGDGTLLLFEVQGILHRAPVNLVCGIVHREHTPVNLVATAPACTGGTRGLLLQQQGTIPTLVVGLAKC